MRHGRAVWEVEVAGGWGRKEGFRVFIFLVVPWFEIVLGYVVVWGRWEIWFAYS
jgi:hypothetical protein